MKFSDAVELGSTLIKLDSHSWLTRKDGERCGCFIGMAMVAEGIDLGNTYRPALTRWPWLGGMRYGPSSVSPVVNFISMLAHGVAEGAYTLDHALQVIRSIEPAEPVDKPVEAQPELVAA